MIKVKRVSFQLFAVVGLSAILAALFFTTQPTEAASSLTSTVDTKGKHCIYTIAPITADDKAANRGSKLLKTQCFDTSDEKDKAINPSGIDSLQATSGQYIIFEIFDGTNFGNGSASWVSSTSCAGDWGVYDLTSYGWDDRADSARGGCGRAVNVFRNAGYNTQFSTVNPQVSDFGILLNNQMSSWAVQ